MKEKSQNTVEVKPNFDGRLSFFKVYENYWLDYQAAARFDNFNQCIKALTGMFAMAAPYIKEKYRDEIRDVLKDARTKLSSSTKSIRNSSVKDIEKAFELINFYAKHLHLPADYDEDDTEEIDLEVFRK